MSEVHPQPGTESHLDRHEGHEADAASAQAPPTSVEPVTPQDTHAAGAASGEQNELLQGNVSGSKQEGAAEKATKLADQGHTGAAGYHSTGSGTGTTGGK